MSAPRLLLCGFGSFPEAPLNPSAAVVASLAREAWSPAGVDIDFLALPVQWKGSVETILRQLQARPAEAVLVVGVAVEAEAFRIEHRGRNRAARERPDHAGRVWEQAFIDGAGAEELAATAPCAAMLAAIAAQGLPAVRSDDAGDYLCNFTLYRLLATGAAARVGFLHVPQARECAEGAAFSVDQIRQAVCAAATAFAGVLSRPAAEPHRA